MMDTQKHTLGDPYAMGAAGHERGMYTREILFANGPHIGIDGPGVAYGSTQAEADTRANLWRATPDMLAALEDALSGWRYIREYHGELYGVAWDRVETAAEAAIAKARGEA